MGNRDESAKSYKERELVNNLIGTVASGGQFAYNIGPKGDGTIDAFDSGVVTEVGQWMQRHPTPSQERARRGSPPPPGARS